MPRQSPLSAARSPIPAEDLRAGHDRARGVRSGVRSDVSIVCVDALPEPLLSSRVCNTVPLCCEVGAFPVSAERTVSFACEPVIDRSDRVCLLLARCQLNR